MMAPNANLHSYEFISEYELNISEINDHDLNVIRTMSVDEVSYSEAYPVSIMLSGDKYEILDGFHRLNQMIRAGEIIFDAEIYEAI